MKVKRIVPKEGQESVWDYPRPPKIESFSGHLRIIFNGEIIVDSNQSFRILETSHPPTYYIPFTAFKEGVLMKSSRTSFCEFKGVAHYYHIGHGDKEVKNAGWGYANPNRAYNQLKGTVSVYAHLMDSCFVHDEQVIAQEGDFYGGWITANIVGPFKGGEGTWGW